MASKTITIQGKLLNRQQQPLPNLRIEAWDNDLLVDDFVGEAVSDALGNFTITFTQKRFKELFMDRKPDLYFKIYFGNRLLKSTANETLLNVSGDMVSVELVLDIPIPAARNIQSTVAGHITDGDGQPLPGLRVVVYNVNMREWLPLGDTFTDRQGRYSLLWTAPETGDERKTADIGLGVYTRESGAELYKSGMENVRFNASANEQIDVIITGSIPADTIEYDSLLNEVTSVAGNVAPADLQENKNHRDITFLSKELETPTDKIEHLAVAHRLQNLSKIEAPFFYALLRKNTLLNSDPKVRRGIRISVGIETDGQILLYDAALTDKARIEADIKSAVDEKIVSASVTKSLKRNLESLAAYQKAAQAYYTDEYPKKTVNLVTNFVKDGKIDEVQQLFAQHKNDLGKFFDLVSDPSFYNTGSDAQSAQTHMALSNVFGLGNDFIPEVAKAQGIEKPEDVRKLAKLNKADWVKEISQTKSAPKNKELIGTYASAIVRRMEKEFPTLAYAAQLEREKKPVLRNQEKIVGFFSKHEGFDFMKHNVDIYLKEHRVAVEESDAIREELKAVQRVFKLVPHYGKTKALGEKNIRSAQSIVATGETRFVNEVAPEAGIDAEEAKEIYRRADRKHTASMLLMGDLQDSMSVTDIAAFETKALSKKLEAVSQEFPNLKTLFKLTDTCECEHCRSVYSPAAYLVEIFEFLHNRTVTDTTTVPPTPAHIARDVLFNRRPDLGEIDLSCANANTPVKYIDLVCELLEEVILPQPGIPYSGDLSSHATDPLKGKISADLYNTLKNAKIPITPDAVVYETESVNGDSDTLPHYVRDNKAVCRIEHVAGNTYKVYRLRQTLSSAEELDAAPEYVNTNVYSDVLADSRFAFKLPFDLNHTEARAYFNRFDVDRATLMEAFQNTGGPSEKSIAAERLGLTDTEREIIVKEMDNETDQQLYWNVPSGTVKDYLTVVSQFLNKTRLLYKDLMRLLSLGFINPDGKLYIHHNDFSCNTDKKEIANLDLKAVDRIHRFLRLQKKTGWKYEVLDEIIRQKKLGNQKLDDDCLIQAARLKTISDRTGLKIDELVGFFGEIPHTTGGEGSPVPLYHQIFLNKAKNGTVDEGLLPEKVDLSASLSTYTKSIAVCLQLKQKDLETLLPSLPDDKLTFANLSTLLAASRLLKKLKIKPQDWITLRTLTGLTVSDSPGNVLKFLDTRNDFSLSPHSVADIQFLIRHEAANLDERVIKKDKITELLNKLDEAYDKTDKENASAFDANLTADENREAFLSVLSGQPDMQEADVKTITGYLAKEWTTPAAAKNFLNEKLDAGIDRTAINAAVDALAATAPGADISAEQKAFIQAVLDGISVFRKAQGKQTALTQWLSDTFKTEPGRMQILLRHARVGTDRVADVLTAVLPKPIDETTSAQAYAAVRLLQKMLILLQPFGLSDTDMEWYLQNSAGIGWLRPDGIPYDGTQPVVTLAAYLDFAKTVAYSKQFTPVTDPADAEKPVTFFTVADLLSKPTTEPEFMARLALLTGHETDLLTAVGTQVIGAFQLVLYRDIRAWDRVSEAIGWAEKLEADMPQVQKYLKPVLTDSDTADLRASLKSRYSEDTWLSTLKEIMDKIRPQKRDALVAYLLATQPEMKDENDLYDYLLVDVEMEACMPSSRIVQAHNSVQLFAQRCLMGLEPEAVADTTRDPDWEQWKWMKNYRVWEANRKVFLYPENWYDVTLTDDKTFLLTEFINEIQQNELTDYNAEQALIRYLEKLDGIAFLEVMATWYDTVEKIMHVFARTKGGDPASYYYRRFEQEQSWTPWEKVELEIPGDHLLAFMRNNRLQLAWPVFSEVADPDQGATLPKQSGPPAQSEQPIERPRKKMKIQLAVSEYANKTWQPKKVSQDAILTPSNYVTGSWYFNRNLYNLVYAESTEQIMIFRTPENNSMEINGIFNITGCKGYPELLAQGNSYYPDFFPDFKDTWLLAQRYREMAYRDSDDLSVMNGMSPFAYYEILRQTPGNFRLTYAHQFTFVDMLAFFYQLFVRVLNRHNEYSVNKRDGYKIPLGTLLPYFMEDSSHSYVIIPGFYKKITSEDQRNFYLEDTEKRTVSNVFKLFEDIVAWFNKMKRVFQEAPPSDFNQAIQIIITDADFQNILKEMAKYELLDDVLDALVGTTGDDDFDAWLTELRDSEGLVYGEQFKNMYHPLVCALRSVLYKDGIPALMSRDTQLRKTNFNFKTHYVPDPHIVPLTYYKKIDGSTMPGYPIEDLDFSSDGSYSVYNWDLFFRVPLHIATTLTRNQRFEESMAWFHYMFNPTGALPGDGAQKYWVTKPFFLNQGSDYEAQRIDMLLDTVAGIDSDTRDKLEYYISQWRKKPFRPDVVAKFRPVAYQKALLMKYIDNLTEWGDYLFRQDTMESVAQATQMYILADKLLGPKPLTVPPAVKPPYATYNQLAARLDNFGNTLIQFENLVPDLDALPYDGNELPLPPPASLSMLYFCIPRNEQMLAYWDRIADRLFKIRHCQNIDGVERSLALFAPPIDPAMLVRAAASGLDLSSILAGLNAPTPYYRFNVLVQKAVDLAQEVRNLGNGLLQALEKKDSEALSLLRNKLELAVLNATTEIKRLQIDESKVQIEVLKRTKKVTEERQSYYVGIEKISSKEQLNLDKLEESHNYQKASQIIQASAAVAALIPDLVIGASGFGGSPHAAAKWGGTFIAHSATAAASVLNVLATVASYEANKASILGGYDRRYNDWKLQERLATKELASIDQQIAGAEIKRDIALSDLKNHELQIENNKKTDDFMRSKFTNKELYDWMIGQIGGVYFKSYKLAHDFAKKAERSYQFELGNGDTFINFGYWDSMKKGLQSADNLIHDLKRMETGYMDKNKREYEITKHVSLAQLDPLALVRLRATGICDFDIPEVLYDMDHPGQYFRRLKSVSVTLPCVAGPHTSVSAKLSLVNNRYRKNTDPDNDAGTGYTEDPGNDSRFVYNVGAIQSIAVSNAQNDSGMFELNFKDDRYLPFEGTGAISGWRLELPTEVKQFDYTTISDVVLHIKYTAREGGSGLKMSAGDSLKDRLAVIRQGLQEEGLHVAIHMRHEWANEWHLLKKNGAVDLTINKMRLPYIAQPFEATVESVMFVAKVQNNPASFTVMVDGADVNLAEESDWGLCREASTEIEIDTPFQLSVAAADKAKLEDLMLVVKYSF